MGKVYRFLIVTLVMISVSVGSENPVKVEAVKNAVQKIWGYTTVIAVKCLSGVSDQPTSDDEAIEGALTRAQQSLEKTGADYGIGFDTLMYRVHPCSYSFSLLKLSSSLDYILKI